MTGRTRRCWHRGWLTWVFVSLGGCDPSTGATAAKNAVDLGFTVATAVDMGAAPDGGASTPLERPASDHPALAQVPYSGGTVLEHMELWTVVFRQDAALGAEVQHFSDWMLGSAYWTESLAEYGVGAGRARGVIVLDDPPPLVLDDGQIGPYIDEVLESSVMPPANPNTALVFVLPASTRSTLFGAEGCTEYAGYHSERVSRFASGTVPYAVVLQCASAASAAWPNLTSTLSHEAAEAATDPRPDERPAWVNSAEPLGGEVADLCLGLNTIEVAENAPSDGDETVDPTDSGSLAPARYEVTRIYSTRIAASGKGDPCVPAPNRPYFNVALSPAVVQVELNSHGTASVVAELEPFSYGSVGMMKWALAVEPPPGVTVTPDHGNLMAGETVPVMISVGPQAAPGVYPLFVFTKAEAGGENDWFGTLLIR